MDERIKVEIDPKTFMALEIQKFDKLIAEAEAQVAELKRQKVTFIFDTNIQDIVNQRRAMETKSKG